MINKIVGIGACVMDTLITVPEYPQEDTKLRLIISRIDHFGNTLPFLIQRQDLNMHNCMDLFLDMMTHFGHLFTLRMVGDADAE